MPNEVERRREDWIDGAPLLLEDGQVWTFPKPTREFRIRAGSSLPGVSPIETNRRFGPSFWKAQKAMSEALDGRMPDEPEARQAYVLAQYQAIADVAADLLLRNYNLTEDELVELLPIIEDDANSAIWIALTRIALGISPKPSTAGNE